MSENGLERVQDKAATANIEEVVSRYESRAYALYELLVPGAEKAGENLAQAFARAISSAQLSSAAPLEALLYREVIASAVDHMQDWGGCVSEDSAFQPSVLPSLATRKVDSAVHTLPIEYRVVFSLRDVLRLPSDLVQQILSITDIEIRAYLHRARLMLFRAMREAR